MVNYEEMSLVELRLAAKKLGIKSVTTFKKQELLDKVLAVDGAVPENTLTEQKTNEHDSISDGNGDGATVIHTEKSELSSPKTDNSNDINPKPARADYTRNSGFKMTRDDNSANAYEDNSRQVSDNGSFVSRRHQNYYSTGMGNNQQARPMNNNRMGNMQNRRQGQQGYRNGAMNGNRMQMQQKSDQMSDRMQQTSKPVRLDVTTLSQSELAELDSGETKTGILEVMAEGYGFVRCDNYLPGEEDVYVAPQIIRKYHLRTGDIVKGNLRIRNQNEKFAALLYLVSVNECKPDEIIRRVKFENLTPVFPDERIRLETMGAGISMRMMDLISPIGKGQRGMIVSQPKTGKTTLLKQVAKAVKTNHPKMHLLVLLIDERPEEVTDIKESILGHNVEVIYSTFDELPENHKRVSEMVIERAKRLVEHGEDVMILLDSITRLARAYNLTVQPSGRTLSGGLDPAALHMPKRFFGAARNMREGGSLTILATALVDTGSKMDDVVFEEFKGTGNMELVLDRKLSEKRVFPAIDLPKSSTRREDLLLTQEEIEANFLMRKAFGGVKTEEAVEHIIEMFRKTKNNQEFIQLIKKVKIV